jgi:NitT/TauT family transport system substrate-binding protein
MKSFASLLGAALLIVASSPLRADEKLTYNMSWLPQGSSVGVAVALDQGWFKADGLDVSIVRGYGGNRTANELDQGQFEIGYVDPISLILNRSNGGKIQLIGAVNTQWPGGICFATKQHPVHSLEDLKGLTMGGGSASPVHNVVPAWLELNGRPRDDIHMLRMDPAVVDSSFVEGKIDLAECWRASNRSIIKKQAKAANLDIGWIEYSDYKLNAYGSGFAAREEMIAKQPDTLRKFLKSAYRGYDFARAHPDQAAEIMLKMFPTLDREVVADQISDINVLIVDPKAATQGLGYLRDDRMASTLDFVDKAFQLNGKVKVNDLYTNALLPK